MAKLEIPSIVMHSGCGSAGGGDMEQHQKKIFHLAKQDEFDLELDQYVQSPIAINIEDKGGGQTNVLDNEEGAENTESRSHSDNEVHCEGANCNGETSQAEHSPVLSSPTSVPTQNSNQEGRIERHKAGTRASRVKLLVRSQAVHDDTSPPPDLETVASNSNMLTVSNGPANNSQTQSKSISGKQLRTGGQGSSQSSIEGSSPALSRDSSTDTYTDSTGIDLQQFIIDTLHKNQKDRLMLLKLEQDLVIFVKDNTRQSYKFPQMSSYNRMLVHRVAAFFGLDHNVDQNGTAIIVNKTKNTRIPDIKFREQIKDELLPEEPKKCILRRDYASFEDYKESPERQSLDNRRSKSIEEREEEYVKARARIFNQEEGLGELNLNYNQERMCSYCSSQEDLRWTNEHSWSSTDSDSSGKPLPQQGLKNGMNELEVQNGTDKVANIALLTKPDPSKDSHVSGKSLRPAITKASSFGGISLLTRESGSVTRKDSVPRLTKAESFNVASVSPNTSDPQVSTISTTTSASSKLAVSTHLPVQNQNSTFSQTSSHSTSPSPFFVPPTQPIQHLPVQLPSQPSSSWVTGARDTNMTLEFASVCSGQSVLPLSFVDTVPPGNFILNHSAGTPYLSEGAVYRQKNIPSQALIVAPLQMLNTPVAANVPLLNQASSGSSLQAQHHLSQQIQQQQQQQQPALQGTYTVVYIPYIPSQIHSSHTQQPVTQMQGSHYQASSESKQYHHDAAVPHIDLVNQMANLNFLSSQIPGLQSQDSVSPGNGAEVTAPSTGNPPFVTQGYIVPTVKPSNFAGQQGNIGQTPVYFMPQLPYSSSIQPTRFLYPSDNIINTLASGSIPSTNVDLRNQNVRDVPSQVISQPSNQQISGQQYMSGVSLFGVSQNTKSSATTPVINYTVTSQAGSSTVTTTTTSVLAPSGIPLQIYPFTNMLLANPSNSTPLLTTMASSQTVQVTNVIPPLGAPTPSTTVPLYLMNIANNTTSSNTSHLGSSVGSTFAAFCSQTQPSQNTASANPSTAVSNQSLPGSSPFINYAYTSPLQSSHLSQPAPSAVLNPGSHASNTPGQLNPNLMAAFHVLRPGIPLVTNLRNTTPPPSIIQAQFPHSAKSSNRTNISYPLTKLKDFTTGDSHVLNAGFVNHDHQKGAQSNSLQFGNQEFHQSSGAMYRRGVPLMQDIRFLGHPLQHQINPLMLPRQHIASRNHPTVGNAPVSSRPSKMRKQRSKGNGLSKSSVTNTNSQSSVTNITGNSILEVEGLPEGMKRSEVERYLEMVAALGAKIQFVCPEGSSGSSSDIVNSKCQVLAVFESGTAAQSALLNIKTTKFQLRPTLKHGRGSCVKNF